MTIRAGVIVCSNCGEDLMGRLGEPGLGEQHGPGLCFRRCATIGCEAPGALRLEYRGYDSEKDAEGQVQEDVCTPCATTYLNMPSRGPSRVVLPPQPLLLHHHAIDDTPSSEPCPGLKPEKDGGCPDCLDVLRQIVGYRSDALEDAIAEQEDHRHLMLACPWCWAGRDSDDGPAEQPLREIDQAIRWNELVNVQQDEDGDVIVSFAVGRDFDWEHHAFECTGYPQAHPVSSLLPFRVQVDYPVSPEKISLIYRALLDAKFDVRVEMVGPTALAIALPPPARGEVLLAVYHNREGWEAVLQVEDDEQYPLPDGPDDPLCDSGEIVRWMREVIGGLGGAGNVLSDLLRVRSALAAMLNSWTAMDADVAAFLLNDGYPFGRSLDDLVADVNDYTSKVARRIGRE